MLEQNIKEIIKQLGYDTIDLKYHENIKLWDSWYKGFVESFHNFEIYNGVKHVKRRRLSMGLAKKICEDKADILLNEKVEININDDCTAKYINNILADNNFYTVANQLIELSSALGTGAFVELIKDNKIYIDTVEAANIYPLTWDNKEIKECAFSSIFMKDGKKHLYINMHVLNNGFYTIYNYIFIYDETIDTSANLADEMGIESEIHTSSTTPFFQIVRPNIVNNADRTMPLGISIFANAIDILQSIDIMYDSYANEFVLGKKRIFIQSDLTQAAIDKDTARLVPVFDTNDVTFYALENLSESSDPIREVDSKLRIDEHIKAINNNLNILSAKCGFGQTYYSFEKGNLKTATEVVSENSELYRKIKKDEILINKALVQMTRAIIYLANNFLNAGLKEDTEITIDFDDSIIEDKAQQRQQALIERNAGLIDSAQYFIETRNMTREQALQFIDEMDFSGSNLEDEY